MKNELLPLLSSEELNNLLQGFAAKLRSILGNHLNDIILYGSYARNEAEEGSDIDIMVLVDLPENNLDKYKDKISDYTSNIFLDTSIIMSPIMHNKAVFNKRAEFVPFYKNVIDEGIKINVD